jgi:segregation and condensation protein B
MEVSEVRQILEVLLFVSEGPLSLKKLKELIKADYADTGNIENIINELKEKYANLNIPYEIKFVADGWTFSTKPQYSPWIKNF